MAVRVRRSVYDLPPGDETLDWYRKAVGSLYQRPGTNPMSWLYVGAVHGNHSPPTPPQFRQFWDQCQHGTWYFLPWHRGYVAAFEALIESTVIDLGGPAEWALPYWNYSADLTQTPQARLLPPAFRDQQMPDGSPNWLWAPRAVNGQGMVQMLPSDISLTALNETVFTDPVQVSTKFGGSKTGFVHFGSVPGAVELVPHNAIHRRIAGYMADPDLAALDPIFWLHHCNIDRLWEEWLALGNGRANPTDVHWLTGTTFDMHDGAGNPFRFTCNDMIDTTTVLHGYRYDTLPEGAIPEAGDLILMAASTEESELAGTSEGPVTLGGEIVRSRVVMHPDLVGKSFVESALPTPMQVYLQLEGVRGTGIPNDYLVLVDLEGDTEPPLQVGILTTFGIANASNPDRDHAGAGTTQVFDITQAAARLRLTTEAAPLLQVTFQRIPDGAVPETVPDWLPDIRRAPLADSTLQVGRVSVYFR